MITKITIDNVIDYPTGTEVEFNYGAYYPRVKGRVDGIKVIPASKHFDATVQLLVTSICPETGDTINSTVSQITTVGIGCYIISKPKSTNVNTSSPWFKP